jgi:hypothetical protein
MATRDDVRRLAMALPEPVEDARDGRLAWRVRDKLFAWERPLRRADLEELPVENLARRAPKRLAKEYLESGR